MIMKNQNNFRKKRSTTSQILTIHRILGVRAKKPRGSTIIWRLLQSIWLHTEREDGSNTSRHGLPKETVGRFNKMLQINTKVNVCSPDGDTDYFDIVGGVPRGVTLDSYLFIICLDYVLRTSIDLMK